MSKEETIILTPAERYIHLSSEYAIKASQDSSQCRFPVGAPIGQATDQYCMSIGIHNATIPHTWYNMDGYNWKIYFQNYAVPFTGTLTGTLPNGNYTTATLASSVQASVRAAQFAAGLPNTFTVAYDASTNFFTFTDGATGPGAQNAWGFVEVENDCYLELGLRSLHYREVTQLFSNTNGVQWSLQAPSMCDLSGYHGIFINLIGYTSNALTSYNGLNQASVLARVPIKQPFGAIETYEPENITYVPVPNAVLTDLQITLTGDDGLPLELNGVDWTMTLHIKYSSIRRQDPPVDRMLPASSIMETQLYGGRRVY